MIYFQNYAAFYTCLHIIFDFHYILDMATQMYILWKIKNYTGLDIDYDIKFNSPVFNVDINDSQTQWRIQFIRPYVANSNDTDLTIKVRVICPDVTTPVTYHIHLIDASNNDINYTFKSEEDIFNLTQCSESLVQEFSLFVELHAPGAEAKTPIWQEAHSFFEQSSEHYLSYVMYPTIPNGSHVIKKLVVDKHRLVWCMKFLCSFKHNRKMSLSLSHPPKNWAIVFQCDDYNHKTQRNESRSLIFDEHQSEHEINAGYKNKSYALHAAYYIRSAAFGTVNPNLIEKFQSWLLPVIIADRKIESDSTLIKTKAVPAPITQPCASSIIPTASVPFQQSKQGFWNYSNYEPQKLKFIAPPKWSEDDLNGCATTAVQKIQNMSIYPELSKDQNITDNKENEPNQKLPIQGPICNIYSMPPPPIYQHSNPAFVQEMFANKEFCDVKLYVDGKVIDAHKLILASCCTYFRDLLKNSADNSTIELTKYDYVTMEALVSFIYNNSLPLLPVTVLEQLLNAAEEFQMGSLKRCCEGELGASLNLQSAPALLVLAHRMNANILMTMAVGFIRIHLAELKKEKRLQSIFYAYPKLAYDLFLQLTSN